MPSRQPGDGGYYDDNEGFGSDEIKEDWTMIFKGKECETFLSQSRLIVDCDIKTSMKTKTLMSRENGWEALLAILTAGS